MRNATSTDPGFLATDTEARATSSVDAPRAQGRVQSGDVVSLEARLRARFTRMQSLLSQGTLAGFLAGFVVGLAEAVVVVLGAHGSAGTLVFAYGAALYGVAGAATGTAASLLWPRRSSSLRRDGAVCFASSFALVIFLLTVPLAVFRVRRDIFQEQLALLSPAGFAVVSGVSLAVGLAGAALYLSWLLLLRRTFLRGVLRPLGSGLALLGPVGALVLVGFVSSPPGVRDHAKRPATAPAVSSKMAPVLFVVVDTLRADHLPAYGYREGRTPFLDRFLDDAIQFDAAYANASWTRPSFASLLTGRYAKSHGVMGKNDALPEAVETLPEVLGRAGFDTAGFVTNFNVAPYFNFHQGFATYEYLSPNFVFGADDASAKLLLVQSLRRVVEKVDARLGRVAAGTAYQDAAAVNRAILSWLDSRALGGRIDPKAPWFLFAAYMDPHDPYFAHPYDGSGYSRAAHPRPRLDEAEALRRLYDGEITYWDTQFGRLVDALRDRGLYDDLMIVVTSDHGEEFGDHGGFWHGTTLYEEQLHVPLFVKLPGNRRGKTRVGHWVQSVDIMPTVLSELSVDVPAAVQGGSLFEGSERLFAEESHEGNQLASVRLQVEGVPMKLITANEDNPRGLARVELYNLVDDADERENLAKASEKRVQVMTDALLAAEDAARRGAERRQPLRVDETAQDRLEALGYSQGDD